MGAKRVVHHQKTPPPRSAMTITLTIAARTAQRMASLATRIRIASRTMPPMMKMLVKLIGNQWAVGCGLWAARGTTVRRVCYSLCCDSFDNSFWS